MISSEADTSTSEDRSATSSLNRYQIWTLTGITFLVSLLIGIIFIVISERNSTLEAKAAASKTASSYAHAIQERLGRSLSATYALAAVLTQGNGDIKDFELLGEQMLAVYGGISSLQLAKDGIISAIVPRAGNEKAFGHNLLEDTTRNKEARLAVKTGELTLAGPFELIQGGMAVIGRLPVFLPDATGKRRFWGFTTALIRTSDLFKASQLNDISQHGYRYELWREHPDTKQRQIFDRTDNTPLSAPVETIFDVPNGKWTLSVEPPNGWHTPLHIAIQLAAAAFISALLALLAKTLLMQPLRLRREVAMRTQDLLQANQKLGDEIRVRESAEAELRLSRYSLEQASDALLWITHDAKILNANPAACRSLGYNREELLQRYIPDIDTNQTAADWPRHWKNIQEQGSQTFESSFRRKDGLLFPVEIVTNFVRFGELELNCAFIRDISERKKSELDLRIAAIAFDSQEGMTVTDANNIILRVNRAFTQITGYSAEEAIGLTPAILCSGRHDANFYQEMWKQIKEQKCWSGEVWNRRKSGEIYPEWLTITAVTDPSGVVTHYLGSFSDASGRLAAEQQIRNLAFYDPLTNLANRRLLTDRLQQAMALSHRKRGYGALLFLDLDNFKSLNDTKGHHTGDQLLTEVARRLKSCVREEDTVARVGGDEFAVVLEDLSKNETQAATLAEGIAKKILRAIEQTYDLNGTNHRSTTSIGISLFIDHENGIEELFKRADTAMYEAKNAGRNTLRFFDPAMQAALEMRIALEANLRQALERNEFELYYQLQIDTTGKAIGAEALLRWRRPSGELISPAEFIPIAEKTGLIVLIGQWVLETACATLNRWQSNQQCCDLQLAVNVSARQFGEKNFANDLQALISRTRIRPEKLKLELTESVVLDNVDETIVKMRSIRELGIVFSMDDFGTGYSSLAYLQQLPLTQLKIDQSFVRNLAENSNDDTIVRTIIALGKSLGLHVIAEGVETETQHILLIKHGCQAFQGYLFSRPIPEKEFHLMLQK
jgi:diguanylate cyclase (GGDEF)-like protein/PAS domain S-box-containing protein